MQANGDDAFEVFNRAQGQGTVRNPYPRFAKERKQAPVLKVDTAATPGAAARLGSSREFYAAMSYDAVSEVLRDGERFSSAGYQATMGLVMGHTILAMDEPDHSRYRVLIQSAFSRHALERWEHDLVRPVVEELVDGFAARGSADLVPELTFPVPVRVIAGMIGIPDDDLADFHCLAVELISIQINVQKGLEASRKLGEMFARVLAERRRTPSNDLMSVLAEAELDGIRLCDDDIFAFFKLLAPAGAETTYRSSSNLLFGLLTHTDQLEAVKSDRSLIPQAIEEGLRWEPPLLGIERTCTRDTEVCGVKIPAGAAVYVNLGSANHDETRYTNPETFDIPRPQRQHMAFAFGPHRCLGMHLAGMETRVMLETIFERLPNVRLDPEAEDVHITGAMFRSPLSLPVLFDPA